MSSSNIFPDISLKGTIDKSDVAFVVTLIAIILASRSNTVHGKYATYVLLVIAVVLVIFTIKRHKSREPNPDFTQAIKQLSRIEAEIKLTSFSNEKESYGCLLINEINLKQAIILCEHYRLLAVNAKRSDIEREMERKKATFEEELKLVSGTYDNIRKNEEEKG